MFLMLIIKGNHIGHHFFILGKFADSPLSRINGPVFEPVTKKYQGKNGGGCFVKKKVGALIGDGAIQTISKRHQSANGDQHIHIGNTTAQ